MDAVSLLSRRGSLVRWLTLLTFAALISTLGDRVIVPTVKAQSAPVGAGFVLDAGDLRFIFHQIEIAQAHAAGGQLFGPGPNQVNEVRLPFGLRTVDGSFNHLTSGQTAFGAADQVFPRLTARGLRAAEQGTSYAQTSGQVTDSQPRIISNLIVDQTAANPAAALAAGPFPEFVDSNGDGLQGPGEPFFVPNVAPDVGLSAPFNVMFTFFGQFFDHGLDLVNKGGSGTVVVPLKADDPLFDPGPDGIPNTADDSPTNFMVLTRGTNLRGPDGILGTADDIHEAINQTTPFVDQNQTYTSHPSHQVFLREYTLNAQGRPVSNGKMIDGVGGHIGNWAEIKTQALTLLGIRLSDQDVFNVPLLLTDAYGYFKRGPRGFPQMVMSVNPLTVLEGTPAAPITTAGAVKTGHAFLDDIAHHAVPRPGLVPDAHPGTTDDGDPTTYDDELLNAHFVTGDGRGNENIALTAVHTIFHSEHNRLRDNINTLINGPGSILTPLEITQWNAVHAGSGWDFGERLFQAARFVTEMQYQHLVFEEFARKLVPSINEFIGDGINFQSDTNPAIFAEFAHQTYRLGHSMLTETISRTRANGTSYDISLLDGFLNPVEFTRNPDNPLVPLNAAQAAGAIFQGGTRQVANEIDEFVTDAVRSNLLGLPLDLPVLNLARGRDQGIPPLNSVRRQLNQRFGDPALAPYLSWKDFEFHMRNPESVVNFMAAYGTHPTITAATTLAGKRDAARVLYDANDAFMLQAATTSGVNNIDLWVGGLAEKIAPFGSMLGTTFNFIFELQLENLQNADRFYYLERLDGLNLLPQLEANSFAELIARNTTAGSAFAADVFARPDFVIDLAFQPVSGPLVDDPATPDFNEALELVRQPTPPPNGTIRYNGPAHVIWNGRNDANRDRVISSEGDDTLRGNDGDDVMEGGAGNDQHIGGTGNDILTDSAGEDVIKGGPGNDAIRGGSGPFDLLQGNEGHDFIVAGNDVSETFGGPGNDIIYSGDGATEMFGGAGDDWIEGGPQLDLLVGDENNQFQDDPNGGHDVIAGGKGDDDYDSEGGDDVMIADVLGTERLEGMRGFDWVTYRGETLPVDADMSIRVVLPPNLDELRDRFDLAEALSGFNGNDLLRGDDRGADPTDPESTMVGHELTATNVNLLWSNPSDTGGVATNTLSTFLSAFGVALPFASGNIITGGLGSDLIEGRGGNDIIDGDAWVNVQLRAPEFNPNTPATIRRVNSLHDLKADVFSGLLNPGSIQIVRTIERAATVPVAQQPPDIDVALFSGPVANYSISGPVNGVFTVTDNVGLDGTDRLRNIEVFRFPNGDGTFTDVTPNPNNAAPAGTPVLSQPNPQEGEPLSVSTAGITDPNGIPAAAFSFQWQAEELGEAGFVNIVGATLPTFTPDDDQVGGRIRAVVSFTDGGGTRESLTSAPSGVVGGLFDGGPANDVITGTPGRDLITGGAGNDTLTSLGQDDQVQGGPGNDTIDTGAGADLAAGGAGDDTINTGIGNDTIRFNGAEGFDAVNGGAGTDAIVVAGPNAIIGLSSLTNVEAITGAGAGVNIVGSDAANTFNFSVPIAVTLTLIDRIQGGGGGDTITGTAVADRIDGQAGADILNGLDGPDDLNGDAGGDTINGGPGGDTIGGGPGNDVLIGENGADQINGGADNDDITGGNGNDTMNGGGGLNVFRFAAGFGADAINGFDADPVGGQDLLNVSALGITAGASFNARVTITAQGANTLITVRNADLTVAGTILLNGVAAATVNSTDFTLAP